MLVRLAGCAAPEIEYPDVLEGSDAVSFKMAVFFPGIVEHSYKARGTAPLHVIARIIPYHNAVTWSKALFLENSLEELGVWFFVTHFLERICTVEKGF